MARVAPCENIGIYYVLTTLYKPLPLLFHPSNRLGNATCAREALFPSFMLTLSAKVGPKVAPRESKSPKGALKASPGTPKNHKKIDLGPHPGKKGAREAPGVPSGRKMTPNINEKRLLLMPTICKKRPAFRLVFQLFWV